MIQSGRIAKVPRRPNLHNFFYLIGSGLVIQMLGTAYRIWLASRIGPAGLGIFSMTYPVYRLLSSVATIGLPLALTKWVAEYLSGGEYREITALKKWSLRTVFSLSLAAALILYLGASCLSTHLFNEPRVKEPLIIIALAIPFSAISAIYRGFFQGFSRMAPTALSEITEQIAEIAIAVIGLTYLTTALPLATYSYPMVGLTAGEIVCLATLLCFRQSPNSSAAAPFHPLTLPHWEILHYSWPLLVNQVVNSLGNASEGILIPQLLIRNGHTATTGTQWLGYLNGMAAPLAYFPLIFLFPLGTVLTPQISSGYKADALPLLRTKVRRFYIATALISVSCFEFILLAAGWLSQNLYHSLTPVALIKILAIGMPFTAFAIINFAILAAIGASGKILTINLWATGLKTALLFLCPYFGITGAAWATTITQIFTALSGALELRAFFIKLDA
jgi:stage V sporulation protein B